MLLTKNFTLEELINSPTAKRLGINNTPNRQQQENLKKLCQIVLQPIRDKYGKSIVVSSGFRCKLLNQKVGGSVTSDHCYGNAADIRSVSDSKRDNKVLFDLIKSMILKGEIVVKQLINEFDYDWIHVSFQDGRTTKKNQILKATKKGGKTIYEQV